MCLYVCTVHSDNVGKQKYSLEGYMGVVLGGALKAKKTIALSACARVTLLSYVYIDYSIPSSSSSVQWNPSITATIELVIKVWPL